MNTLFPVETNFPEGFSYVPDFLTFDEEQFLCNEIEKLELHPFTFQGYTANRKVASFGFDYSFDTGKISKGKAISSSFNFLVTKVSEQISTPQDAFAELLVTEYPPNSVINWHRDAPPFDVIAGISLQTNCVFRLRPFDKTNQSRASIISFPVERRSLYIIQGSARSDWQHSIAPVKQLRHSITLRTLQQ